MFAWRRDKIYKHTFCAKREKRTPFFLLKRERFLFPGARYKNVQLEWGAEKSVFADDSFSPKRSCWETHTQAHSVSSLLWAQKVFTWAKSATNFISSTQALRAWCQKPYYVYTFGVVVLQTEDETHERQAELWEGGRCALALSLTANSAQRYAWGRSTLARQELLHFK